MFNKEALLQELSFKAVRSSGAGGQHVNKVSSKVELIFNLQESLVFNEEEEKERLFNKLQNRLTKDGVLILYSDESRSQHKNKELVINRFFELITEALKVQKKRIPTKIPKHVKLKRLSNKRKLSDKKASRKKPDID